MQLMIFRVGTREILETCVFKYFFNYSAESWCFSEIHVLFHVAVCTFPCYVKVFLVLSFHYVFLHVWNESSTFWNSYLLCSSCSFICPPNLSSKVETKFIFTMLYVNGFFMFFTRQSNFDCDWVATLPLFKNSMQNLCLSIFISWLHSPMVMCYVSTNIINYK